MSKKAWIKLVVIALSVILLVTLIIQNRGENANLNFLFFSPIQIPQILLMIVLFGLGLVAGIFIAFKISGEKEPKK